MASYNINPLALDNYVDDYYVLAEYCEIVLPPLRLLAEGVNVKTRSATSVDTNSATLAGKLESLGDKTSLTAYFEYGKAPYIDQTSSSKTLSSTGYFYIDVTGLSSSQEYYFRAVVTDGETTWKGTTYSFTTDTPVVTYDVPTDYIGYYGPDAYHFLTVPRPQPGVLSVQGHDITLYWPKTKVTIPIGYIGVKGAAYQAVQIHDIAQIGLLDHLSFSFGGFVPDAGKSAILSYDPTYNTVKIKANVPVGKLGARGHDGWHSPRIIPVGQISYEALAVSNFSYIEADKLQIGLQAFDPAINFADVPTGKISLEAGQVKFSPYQAHVPLGQIALETKLVQCDPTVVPVDTSKIGVHALRFEEIISISVEYIGATSHDPGYATFSQEHEPAKIATFGPEPGFIPRVLQPLVGKIGTAPVQIETFKALDVQISTLKIVTDSPQLTLSSGLWINTEIVAPSFEANLLISILSIEPSAPTLDAELCGNFLSEITIRDIFGQPDDMFPVPELDAYIVPKHEMELIVSPPKISGGDTDAVLDVSFGNVELEASIKKHIELDEEIAAPTIEAGGEYRLDCEIGKGIIGGVAVELEASMLVTLRLDAKIKGPTLEADISNIFDVSISAPQLEADTGGRLEKEIDAPTIEAESLPALDSEISSPKLEASGNKLGLNVGELSLDAELEGIEFEGMTSAIVDSEIAGPTIEAIELIEAMEIAAPEVYGEIRKQGKFKILKYKEKV